jgi:hypothetical protein
MIRLSIFTFLARVVMNPYIIALTLTLTAVILTVVIKLTIFKPKGNYNSYNHFS